MAYLTHNAYRDHRPAAPLRSVKIGRVAGAAVLAIAVAASVATLSSKAYAPTDSQSVASAKSDRLASTVGSAGVNAPMVVDGVQRDESRQTTTVVRGASVPFSASSPYLNDQR